MEFSPEAQKKAIISYAVKNNIHIAEDNIFVDEGISGRKAEKRPSFMAMIKKAKEKPKPFDIILVHKFDRFARNREDSVVYKSLLKKNCNIKVVSVTEQLEDDKFSIILESMLEAMAEYYSLNLSEEVKKGMSEKARRGGMQTRPPLGYSLSNGKVIVDEKEKDIVRLIYEGFAWENKSLIGIARMLNDMGYRTKNNGLFQSKSVKYILENPFYIGIIRWNRRNRKGVVRDEKKWIVAKGDHERIIDNELFYEAMKRLKILKKTRKTNHSNQYRHYLSGLIRCSHCKGSMVYKYDPRGYAYFRCRKSVEGACSQKKMISVDLLEKLVGKQLVNDLNNMTICIEPKQISTKDNEKSILKKLDRIDKKYNNIKKAYIEDIDTIEEYKANKEILNKEKKHLKEQLELFRKKIPVKQSLLTLHEILEANHYSLDTRNELMKSYISMIELDVENKKTFITYYVID